MLKLSRNYTWFLFINSVLWGFSSLSFADLTKSVTLVKVMADPLAPLRKDIEIISLDPIIQKEILIARGSISSGSSSELLLKGVASAGLVSHSPGFFTMIDQGGELYLYNLLKPSQGFTSPSNSKFLALCPCDGGIIVGITKDHEIAIFKRNPYLTTDIDVEYRYGFILDKTKYGTVTQIQEVSHNQIMFLTDQYLLLVKFDYGIGTAGTITKEIKLSGQKMDNDTIKTAIKFIAAPEAAWVYVQADTGDSFFTLFDLNADKMFLFIKDSSSDFNDFIFIEPGSGVFGGRFKDNYGQGYPSIMGVPFVNPKLTKSLFPAKTAAVLPIGILGGSISQVQPKTTALAGQEITKESFLSAFRHKNVFKGQEKTVRDFVLAINTSQALGGYFKDLFKDCDSADLESLGIKWDIQNKWLEVITGKENAALTLDQIAEILVKSQNKKQGGPSVDCQEFLKTNKKNKL